MKTTRDAAVLLPKHAGRARAVAEVALILVLFFMQGAWPVPEVNETHYLAKARHYWQPDWCAGDFFLTAADAHQVFYWTFGWLTRVLPLPTVAWVGRVLTWGLLAWSWRRLSVALVPVPLTSVLSAALFATLTARAHMAGEWVIGGVEAKGFAFVFLFLALEAMAREQWRRVWPLLGAASAFHVIIGAWSVILAGVAWLFAGKRRPPVVDMLPSLAIGLLFALPGLIPALALTWQVDLAVLREANRIYVFERLPHHLVIQTFPPEFVRRHLLLFGLWLVLNWRTVSKPADRPLRVCVFAAVGVSLAGAVVAMLTSDNDTLAAGILRYYWYRMSDTLVPLGVALLSVEFIVQLVSVSRATEGALTSSSLSKKEDRHLASKNFSTDSTRQLGASPLFRRPASGSTGSRAFFPQGGQARWGTFWLIFVLAACSWHFAELVARRQRDFRPQADAKIADLAAWREICSWAAEHTPPDALFVTPKFAQSFRWYAGRAEVVSRKDIPQDAQGIIQWWQRMDDVFNVRRASALVAGQPSRAVGGSQRLLDLARRYGADYAIAEADPPLALEVVSPPNATYVIYRLRPAEPKPPEKNP